MKSLLLIAAFILVCSSCGNRKKIIFHSFSGGFACDWSMFLFVDGSFTNSLCADSGSGTYTYASDTIFLQYKDKRINNVIFVIRDSKVFVPGAENNNTMQIQINKLK